MNSTPKTAPWLMLFARILLFFVIQALLAFGFALAKVPSPWENSANWWPLIVLAANSVCLLLLVNFLRREGGRYWDLFKIDRSHILRDVLMLLSSFLIGGPLSVIPNIILGGWLFGDPNATMALFVRPLPLWAAWTGIVLFPLSQGLVELATYFSYIMPRFQKQGMNLVLAISLPALMLSLQHLAMPFLVDIRFILWRGLMYLPFAFFSAILLHRRPRWLPYMTIIHTLMNMSFAFSFLSVAY
ncbi:MAG TPA: hypothetical protein VF498_16050 [Anaerolineales bacterium]